MNTRPYEPVYLFVGREWVDVEVLLRDRVRSSEVDVVAAVELRRQAGLDAHLRGAELPRLLRAADDLGHGKEVTFLFPMIAAERAEGAVLDADVREVDVAIHHVGHNVAGLLPPQLVGDERQGVEVPALDARERDAVLDRHLVAVERPGEDRADVARDPVERGEEATSGANVHGIPSRDRVRRPGPGRAPVGSRPGIRRASRTPDRSRDAREGRSPGPRLHAGARGSAAMVSRG